MTIPALLFVIFLVMITNAFQRFSALIKAFKNTRKAMDKTMKNAYGYIKTIPHDDPVDHHELNRIVDCFREFHDCYPPRLPIIYQQLFNRINYLLEDDPTNSHYQSLNTMVEPLKQYSRQYDGYVTLYNQSLFQFPYSLVARFMHLGPMETIHNQKENLS